MTRTDAREFMMQVFFQMEACNDFNIDNKAEYFKEKKLNVQKTYCDELFSVLCNHKEELDSKISDYSTGWKLNRIPKTDLSVLRVALCELLYLSDIPEAVSINEAVELARRYGTDESAKYVNAILAKAIKER